MKHKKFWDRIAISAVGQIHNYEAFIDISVKDLIGGYKDPMLEHLQILAGKDLVTTDIFGVLHGVSRLVSLFAYPVAPDGDTLGSWWYTIRLKWNINVWKFWKKETCRLLCGCYSV